MERPTDRNTAEAVPPSPPPPGAEDRPHPPDRPPLRRPREDRILAGVAAGLADHLGVDVAIVRILIVVLAVVTDGVGVLAYIAAAIFVPAAEPGAPRPTRTPSGDATGSRDPLFWVGLGLLVLGALWLARGGLAAGQLLPVGGFRSIVVPVVLIAFGLALWRAGDRRVPAAGAGYQLPPTPPTHGTSTERSMTTDTTSETTTAGDPDVRAGFSSPQPPGSTAQPPGSTLPPSGGSSPPPPHGPGQPSGEPAWTPPPAPEPRPRSLLTRATLGLALVTIGALWSLRVAGVLTIGWGTILAAALLVIGLGLLVGSVIGRARWLVLAGALLAPLVVVGQMGPLPFLSYDWSVDGTSAGEIRATPSELSELRSEYQLGAGSIRLDLRELDLDGEEVDLRIGVGAGEIHVTVPDDAEVAATARSGIGDVQLFDGRSAVGVGAGEQRITFTPEGDPVGRINLELEMGFGEIDVDAAPRPLPADSAPEEDPTSGDRVLEGSTTTSER